MTKLMHVAASPLNRSSFSARVTWLPLALTLLFFALYAAVEIRNPRPGESLAVLAITGCVALFPVVGALIASRESHNPIGWIFCGAGVALAFSIFSEAYGHYSLIARPGSLPGGAGVAWAGNLAGSLFFFPTVTFLLLLFPTGRLTSARWKPVAWASAAAFAFVEVGTSLAPGRMEGAPYLENPLGVESLGGFFDTLAGVGWMMALACIVLSAASLVVRLRRSRGDERQQIKWFVYAATFLAISVIPISFAERFEFIGFAIAGLPIATGIAILKYRLYAIDVIINRSLVYGSLTAVLTLAYYGVVLLLQGLFSHEVASSPIAVASSTLAAAALFRPARASIQTFIDRRFYRSKYDAIKTVETFAARLRDQIDLETLKTELVGVIADTMQPARASLWLRSPERQLKPSDRHQPA